MSGHRGRPGGFEAIKRGPSREDAQAAWHLERSLEKLFAGQYQNKIDLKQYIMKKNSDYRTANYQDQNLEAMGRLSRWIMGMKAENCQLDVVLMAVVDGSSFSHLDKKMRRRKGWSREQLILALRIFRSS